MIAFEFDDDPRDPVDLALRCAAVGSSGLSLILRRVSCFPDGRLKLRCGTHCQDDEPIHEPDSFSLPGDTRRSVVQLGEVFDHGTM
jgi:hypothetical protein